MDDETLMSIWDQRVKSIGRLDFTTGKDILDSDLKKIRDIIFTEYPHLFECKTHSINIEYIVPNPQDREKIRKAFQRLPFIRNFSDISSIVEDIPWLWDLKYENITLREYIDAKDMKKASTTLIIHNAIFSDKYPKKLDLPEYIDRLKICVTLKGILAFNTIHEIQIYLLTTIYTQKCDPELAGKIYTWIENLHYKQHTLKEYIDTKNIDLIHQLTQIYLKEI